MPLEKRRLSLVPLGLAFLLLVSSVRAQSSADVIARVNGLPITVERFNASYVGHLIKTGRNDTPERRYAHLNDLIDAYLLAEEARRRGLEDAGYQEYVDREIRKAVGGRFFEIAFADSFPDPSEADIREAFRRSMEKVHVRHLFFNNPADADSAYARLERGGDFVALANEVFGTAAFDSAAGDLGVAGYWDLDDSFAEAAYALNVGEYSRPVKSGYGWHVIRLENRIVTPVLTESEYERGRDGTSHQLRARRFRMQGTRFVQTFMDSLEVEVNRSDVRTLASIIGDAVGSEDESTPKLVLAPSEVSAIEEAVAPESVLATYEIHGERREFTALDYFRWLEDLPYREVRNRTAASVGRALRNQALAERGLSLGLQSDTTVVRDVQHTANLYLADALRSRLRTESDVEMTDDELASAFDHMGFRKLKSAVADYWHIRFETLEKAEAARDALAAGGSPSGYAGYESASGGDLRTLGELGTYIQTAPLRTPVLIGTGDGGWYVVKVDSRDVVFATLEETREEIARRVGPHMPEMRLLRELRSTAEVRIDTALFEEMMRLGR